MNLFSQLGKTRYFQDIVYPLVSRWISLILLFPFCASAAPETLFHSDEEVDVHYKKQVPIYLQHELGDVSITGWNQDLIRVKMKKTITADTEENAKIAFKKFTVISLETPTAVELRVGTPQGTDLLTKLRNRQVKKNVRVDLEIRAPSALALSILLGSEKKLKLAAWRGKINITGKKSALELNKLRANAPLNVNCTDCSLSVSESEFSGSILLSDQKIEIKKSKATPQPVLIFSQKGSINLENTEGDFQMRSQSGEVLVEHHVGALQIQSDSGKVKVDDLDGDLDIQTQTGEMDVFAKKVSSQLELKNKTGAINVVVPRGFAGEVNLQSIKGDVYTDFSVEKNKKKMEMLYGPELKGRLFGTIGSSSKVSISASSESGNIELKQRGIVQ